MRPRRPRRGFTRSLTTPFGGHNHRVSGSSLIPKRGHLAYGEPVRNWQDMPKPWLRAALSFGIFFGVLAGFHVDNVPLKVVTSAVIFYAAFNATYFVWRFQARRPGDPI